MNNNKRFISTPYGICITGLFMALVILMCTVSIPVPGGHLYLCDVAICTAAILINDPVAAFIVGGVGTFLGDFFFYPAPMFVSLVTHGLQAIAICLFTHRIYKENHKLGSIIGVTVGAVILVIGYSLGRAFVYSTPHYAYIKLPYEILQAVIGASAAIFLCWKMNLVDAFHKITKGIAK